MKNTRIFIGIIIIALISVGLLTALKLSQTSQDVRQRAAVDIISTVCPSGTPGQNDCDYIGGDGIQQAVDAAPVGTSTSPTTILIKSGTYTRQTPTPMQYGNYLVNCYVNSKEKHIVLLGENNAILDGANSTPMAGICARAATITVENLRITGLKEPATGTCQNPGDVCPYTDAFMLIGTVSASITKNSIDQNNDTGITLDESAHATIAYNNISSNKLHGIVFNGDNTYATINGNIIANNYFEGIALEDGHETQITTITNNTIVQNTPDSNRPGGISIYRKANTLIKNNLIANNFATGIFRSNGPVDGNTGTMIEQYNFVSNNAVSNANFTLHTTDLVNVNPQFIAPTNQNWAVTSTSPACASGENSTYAGAYACRPNICNSLVTSGTTLSPTTSITATTNAQPPTPAGSFINTFMLKFYNKDNMVNDSPQAIKFNGIEYTQTVTTPQATTETMTINYAALNAIDENTGQKPDNIQVNGYLILNDTRLSLPVGQCVKSFSVTTNPPPTPLPSPSFAPNVINVLLKLKFEGLFDTDPLVHNDAKNVRVILKNTSTVIYDQTIPFVYDPQTQSFHNSAHLITLPETISFGTFSLWIKGPAHLSKIFPGNTLGMGLNQISLTSPEQTLLAGDAVNSANFGVASSDNTVDLDDFTLFVSHFGSKEPGGPGQIYTYADFDYNDKVDGDDYYSIVVHFDDVGDPIDTSMASPTPIPSPTPMCSILFLQSTRVCNGSTVNTSWDWNKTSEANTYRFQIDDSANFNSPILDTIISENTYQLNNLISRNYYGRVRVETTDLNCTVPGTWSTTEVTESCVNPPATPPPNSCQCDFGTVTLNNCSVGFTPVCSGISGCQCISVD